MYGPDIVMARGDTKRLSAFWAFLSQYPQGKPVWNKRLSRFAHQLLARGRIGEGLTLLRVVNRQFTKQRGWRKAAAKSVVRFLAPAWVRRAGRQIQRIPVPGFTRKVDVSIGIYSGESPMDLSAPVGVCNPVLTSRDVTDISAGIVADPFMVCDNGTWHMFFEAYNNKTMRGDIALATSEDGIDWTYRQIVLQEPFHLSYPYVFKLERTWYMIPEASASRSVRLYRASRFPSDWVFVKELLSGAPYTDASVFLYEDRWWMFVETSGGRHDTLCLFWADDLMGPWTEHLRSPLVVGDPSIARPAGRVILRDNKAFRFAQDCERVYGSRVRGFEIMRLTPTIFEEKEVSDNVLYVAGEDWNSRGMHHVDVHELRQGKWLACVDGFSESRAFGIKR
jgi:hypothetical protein